MLKYQTPVGGTRRPVAKPGPRVGHIPMAVWRQPVGGVKQSTPRPT